MFYYFLEPLRAESALANVLCYLTIRIALAAVTAFGIMVVFGNGFIHWLRDLRVTEDTQKTASRKLAELHRAKKDTPTMGGLLVLASIVTSVVLWARLDNSHILIGLFTLVGCGLVGFVDDAIKLCRPEEKGMSGRAKMILLGWVSLLAASLLYFGVNRLGAEYTTLYLPFMKGFEFELGLAFIPLMILVLISSANAVNLTDGLDGLATGCTVMVALAFTALAYIVGRTDFTSYLGVPFIPEAAEGAVLGAAIFGGGLGFLWFNCHPAEVFLGDTGSLSLGAGLGFMAVSVRHEFLLVVAGGIFVAEALSVISQVTSYKTLKKRIFRCAPLHHHFQFGGWAETKVTTRFWIVGSLLALTSLMTLKVR